MLNVKRNLTSSAEARGRDFVAELQVPLGWEQPHRVELLQELSAHVGSVLRLRVLEGTKQYEKLKLGNGKKLLQRRKESMRRDFLRAQVFFLNVAISVSDISTNAT